MDQNLQLDEHIPHSPQRPQVNRSYRLQLPPHAGHSPARTSANPLDPLPHRSLSCSHIGQSARSTPLSAHLLDLETTMAPGRKTTAKPTKPTGNFLKSCIGMIMGVYC
jgi:hypothetical protein